MDVFETEVLVVGAGPVGVTLGLLLADLGVSAVVIDKRTSVSELPRARGLNARGAEILRMVHVEDDMVRHALPVRPELQVRPDLAHEPVVIQPTGGTTFSTVSPCEGIAISQDVLESVLRKHLRQRRSVQLRLGWRLTSLHSDAAATAYRSVVVDPEGRTREVRSRFVVGADGWRSDVRSLTGIAEDGVADLGRMRSVRFAAQLGPWLGDPPPAFVRLTGSDGVLLLTHTDGRWVFIVADLPALEPDAARLVSAALAVNTPVSVLEDNRWTAAVQQADRFSAAGVFLAGDAAHRVTPAGATGITSGLADAANLAWKLAGTLQGWGGPRLLDSYQLEREPVARWIGSINAGMWADAQQGRSTPVELRWLEFGYRYHSPVIAATQGMDVAAIDVAAPFAPGTRPGDRAPHAILDDGRSTIDLTGQQFTLLIAGHQPRDWAPASGTTTRRWRGPLQLVSDVGEQVRNTFQLDPGQAVLIRPDGHIAWRSDRQSEPMKPTTLDDAIRQATGW